MKKGLTVMNLLLIFFILRWHLYLLTMLLIGCGSSDDLNESTYFNNPRDDVDGLKMNMKFSCNFLFCFFFLFYLFSFFFGGDKAFLSGSIIFPEIFIALFEKMRLTRFPKWLTVIFYGQIIKKAYFSFV